MRVYDEFDRYLRRRKAIYMYYLQGVPAVMAIDKEKCLWFTKSACRICEKHCDRDAIDFQQQDEIIKLENIGSVIIATGYDVLEDYSTIERYGYGKYNDVDPEPTKKEFAEFVMRNIHPPYRSVMFAMWDKKPYNHIIWKIIKPEFRKL